MAGTDNTSVPNMVAEPSVNPQQTDELQNLRQQMQTALTKMEENNTALIEIKINEIEESISNKIDDLEKYMKEDSSNIKYTVHEVLKDFDNKNNQALNKINENRENRRKIRISLNV